MSTCPIPQRMRPKRCPGLKPSNQQPVVVGYYDPVAKIGQKPALAASAYLPQASGSATIDKFDIPQVMRA